MKKIDTESHTKSSISTKKRGKKRNGKQRKIKRTQKDLPQPGKQHQIPKLPTA